MTVRGACFVAQFEADEFGVPGAYQDIPQKR